MRWWFLLPLASGLALGAGERPTELLPPVHVEAAGRPVDVEREGHSAPCLGDFDGDGLPDLLVGSTTRAGCASTATRGRRGNRSSTTSSGSGPAASSPPSPRADVSVSL